jgi:hypothetical protein
MSPEVSSRTWMPAVHAGMTKSVFSLSVGERKIMNHCVVILGCGSRLDKVLQ